MQWKQWFVSKRFGNKLNNQIITRSKSSLGISMHTKFKKDLCKFWQALDEKSLSTLVTDRSRNSKRKWMSVLNWVCIWNIVARYSIGYSIVCYEEEQWANWNFEIFIRKKKFKRQEIKIIKVMNKILNILLYIWI